jgi:hypothetical protein
MATGEQVGKAASKQGSVPSGVQVSRRAGEQARRPAVSRCYVYIDAAFSCKSVNMVVCAICNV